MDVTPADPRSALLRASLERFWRQASLKFDLPLVEMEAAEGDITTFMNTHLQELSSQTELPELIKEAARLMGWHNNRIWELVQDPDLDLSGVSSRVIIGLLARQPIEADLFPGILEGLAGNLGLSPAGTVNPPRSRQEGMMRRWATALRQAAYDPSGTGQGSASSTTPLGLHLNYDMEFRSRSVGDIPPALTSPLLPSFPILEKPRPGEPLPPPAAQQPEETDSPQSPSPDEEDGADTQPHRQKMLVSSLYPTTGQITMVPIPPLGGRSLPLAGNGVRKVNHPMRCLRRNQQTGMRLHPNRSRTCLPKQQRPFSFRQGMSCMARTIHMSRR